MHSSFIQVKNFLSLGFTIEILHHFFSETKTRIFTLEMLRLVSKKSDTSGKEKLLICD